MPINYEPFFAILRRKNLKLVDIKIAKGISRTTLAKFNKNEPVNLLTLEAIAEFLDCDIGDLITFKPKKKKNK